MVSDHCRVIGSRSAVIGHKAQFQRNRAERAHSQRMHRKSVHTESPNVAGSLHKSKSTSAFNFTRVPAEDVTAMLHEISVQSALVVLHSLGRIDWTTEHTSACAVDARTSTASTVATGTKLKFAISNDLKPCRSSETPESITQHVLNQGKDSQQTGSLNTRRRPCKHEASRLRQQCGKTSGCAKEAHSLAWSTNSDTMCRSQV